MNNQVLLLARPTKNWLNWFTIVSTILLFLTLQKLEAGESRFDITYKPINDTQGAFTPEYGGVMILPAAYVGHWRNETASVTEINRPYFCNINGHDYDFNLVTLYNIVVRVKDPDDAGPEHLAKKYNLQIDLTSSTLRSIAGDAVATTRRPDMSKEDARFSGEDIVAATVYCALMALPEVPVTVSLKFPDDRSIPSWRRLEGVYHFDQETLRIRNGGVGPFRLRSETIGGWTCYSVETQKQER